MTAALDSATLGVIHDLEAEVDHLTGTQISLQASLDAMGGELERTQARAEKLERERDYFKMFACEISTRLHVIKEGIDAITKASELAGYRPAPIASYRDASLQEVDAAVSELAQKFGANGAKHEEPTPGR